MKITKFAFAPLFLSSACLAYRLRETIDPSIIAAEFGHTVPKFENGLSGLTEAEVTTSFMGSDPLIVDHLYHLTFAHQKLLVKDDEQHRHFMDLVRSKLETFSHDRERQYNRTKAAFDEWNKVNPESKENNSVFHSLFGHKSDKTTVDSLKQAYESNLHELEMIDKKILKLERFLEYCSDKGCLAIPEKSPLVGNIHISNIHLPKFHLPNFLKRKNVTGNKRA